MKKLIALLLALIAVFALSTTAIASAPDNLITKEQAKEIALDHAGYDEAQVRFSKAKLDIDDGRYEYEGKAYLDGYEYEFEINAASGVIINWDSEPIEYDDDDVI